MINFGSTKLIKEVHKGAIAWFTRKNFMKTEELIEKYKTLKNLDWKICNFCNFVQFKTSPVDGRLLRMNDGELINSWGYVQHEDVVQSQQWLAVREQLRAIGGFRY